MTENRSSTTPPQDPNPLRNLTETLFGEYIDQCWVAESSNWDGCFYSRAALDGFSADSRHHFSCALMKKGAKTRSILNFDGAVLFVLDDVGTVGPPGTVSITGSRVDADAVKWFAPETGYGVETSKGNFQVGWRIEVERDFARWDYFVRAMAQHKLFGRGVHDAVHYFRTETGKGKPEKGAFQTRLAKPWTGKIWKLDDLAAAFGVDMSPEAVKAEADRQAAFSASNFVPVVSVEVTRAILKALPNRDTDKWFDGRTDWVGIAHAIRRTSGEIDGRDLWLDWNGQRAQKHGEPERVWDTLPDTSTNDIDTLRWWLIKIHGETSDTFAKLKQKIADDQAPLTAIPDAEPMPEPETTKAKKLDELLAAIRATVKVPPHHVKRDYDQHWLPKAGGLLTMRNLAKSPPIAPPVMFEPYVRSGLAVLGGAPSIGKSTLALNQALAVVANRPDLIRDGQGRLQFPGDVIYVSNEDDVGVVERRSLAWAKHHGVDLDKTPFEIALVRTSLLRKAGENKWLIECLDVLQRILEHVKTGREVAMIVVDTLATTVIGADEQQIRDMGEVMRLLEKLAKAFWGSVVFLHHTVKEAWVKGAADQTSRSLATIRGSGGIVGNHTRGAALACAPDKAELDAHPDWIGRDIVVEYLLKANDGRESYVVCYYERVLVDVQQISAVDPTKMETRKEPVLVPIPVTPLGQDMKQLQGYLDTLRAWKGDIRVVEKVGANGSPNSVQSILGVSNGAAKTIVDGLVSWGVASVKTTKINRHDVVILEISGPF